MKFNNISIIVAALKKRTSYSKISLKRSLFIVSILGIIFTSSIIFFLSPDLSAQSSDMSQALPTSSPTLPSVIPEQVSYGLPIRLKIPGIKVDAAVKHVGLTKSGAMDVPKGPNDVVWFNLGPRPGEKGSAVMAGHYGWKNRTPAVFDNLYKLQKGDRLSVEDEKGAVITFVVRESRRYDPKADASDVFGSNDGGAHLNLITCEGVWNKAAQSYSKRLVIFTDIEME